MRVQCALIRGDPPLKIRWQKDHISISQLTGVDIKQYDEYSSTLVIHHLSRQHAGNYKCIAENPAGSREHSAVLQVNGNSLSFI